MSLLQVVTSMKSEKAPRISFFHKQSLHSINAGPLLQDFFGLKNVCRFCLLLHYNNKTALEFLFTAKASNGCALSKQELAKYISSFLGNDFVYAFFAVNFKLWSLSPISCNRSINELVAHASWKSVGNRQTWENQTSKTCFSIKGHISNRIRVRYTSAAGFTRHGFGIKTYDLIKAKMIRFRSHGISLGVWTMMTFYWHSWIIFLCEKIHAWTFYNSTYTKRICTNCVLHERYVNVTFCDFAWNRPFDQISN